MNRVQVAIDLDTANNVDPANLQWALYVSIDNDDWEPVPGFGDAVATLSDRNPLAQFFEIDVPALETAGLRFPANRYDYLKVVLINRDDDPVHITSLAAVRLISASESTVSTFYTTDLTLSYQILSFLVFSSTLNLLNADDYTNLAVHTDLNWTPSPYASLVLGYSETRQDYDDAETQKDRSYTVTVPLRPLSTLNVTLGAIRTESYEGSRKTQTNDNYSLNATAIIFPELNANFFVNYLTGELEETDGTQENRENLFSRLFLNARLNRQLTVDIGHDYVESFEPDANTTQETAVNINYRPSDLLYMRLVARGSRGPATLPSGSISSSIWPWCALRSPAEFIYRHCMPTRIPMTSVFGSWDISQIFSLQSQARYFMQEDQNAWNVNIKLLLNI